MKVLKPSKNRLTQGYSDKHKGYDHSGQGDQNYYSSFFGKVVQAKNSETKNWINTGTLTTADYGNYIKVKGEVDGKVYYQLGAHFKPDTVLPVGTEVKKGQVIAQIGNTGNSTGAHSHTEYRDADNHNFAVEFVDEEEEDKPMETQTKEQIIIDSYKATTGEYPSDNEKQARLQKNENTADLIYDLLNGDGRCKPRWLQIWGVEKPSSEMQATLEGYKDMAHRLKEILKLPVGANTEDIIGRVTGLLESLTEAQNAQKPKTVYKYEGEDYERIITLGNLLLIMKK